MKKLLWMAAISAFLTACNSADELANIAPETTEKSVTVNVAFVAETTALTAETRALAMTQDGKIDGEKSTWTSQAFFRKEGSTDIAYAVLTWKATSTGSGYNLVLQNTSITMTGAGAATPKAGETWYMATVSGGAVNSAKNGVTFTGTETQIPFIADWTALEVGNNFLGVRNDQRIQFRIPGTLVKVNITNKLASEAIEEVTYSSNAMDGRGTFSFAGENTAGTEVAWTFTQNSSDGVTYQLRRTLSEAIAVGASASTFVWGMPRTSAETSQPSLPVTKLKACNAVLAKGTLQETFEYTGTMTAKAYAMTVNANKKILQHLPYTPISTGALLADKSGFGDASKVSPDSEREANNGWFTWDEAMAIAGNGQTIAIGGKNWYIPNRNEWFQYVPASSGTDFFTASQVTDREVYEPVQWGRNAAPIAARSIYRSVPGNITYAIRLKSCDHVGGAYRYHRDPVSQLVTVNYFSMDENSAYTIDDIDDELFWTSKSGSYNTIYFYGGYGTYWSSTLVTPTVESPATNNVYTPRVYEYFYVTGWVKKEERQWMRLFQAD